MNREHFGGLLKTELYYWGRLKFRKCLSYIIYGHIYCEALSGPIFIPGYFFMWPRYFLWRKIEKSFLVNITSNSLIRSECGKKCFRSESTIKFIFCPPGRTPSKRKPSKVGGWLMNGFGHLYVITSVLSKRFLTFWNLGSNFEST